MALSTIRSSTLFFGENRNQIVQNSLTDESSGFDFAKPDNFPVDNVKVNSPRKSDSFFQSGDTRHSVFLGGNDRANNTGFAAGILLYFDNRQNLSFGCLGFDFNGGAGHNRRDGMFINQLGMAVAAQKQRLFVKIGYQPLKFDAVNQKTVTDTLLLLKLLRNSS